TILAMHETIRCSIAGLSARTVIVEYMRNIGRLEHAMGKWSHYSNLRRSPVTVGGARAVPPAPHSSNQLINVNLSRSVKGRPRNPLPSHDRHLAGRPRSSQV